MKFSENLLPRCCSSLFILLLFFQACRAINEAMNPHSCSPSACGIIRNISFPFRLIGDPRGCGYPEYELACENNITTVYFHSQKYKVKAINYDNFTIRLVDVSINNTNPCSFPNYSLNSYFLRDYPYKTRISRLVYPPIKLAWPINFMSCPYPLKNSSLFTRISTSCPDAASYQTYIMIGRMKAADVRDKCRVDVIALTSWKFKDVKNVSVSEIHQSLVFGFELSWAMYPCTKCGSGSSCGLYYNNSYTCSKDASWLYTKWMYIRAYCIGQVRARRPTLIFVLIAVILYLGISIPARIIIAFVSVLGLLTFVDRYVFYGLFELIHLHLWLFIGLIFAARFIIVCPFVMWILIYKFQRRHLSRYDAIESFLQSDNQLMPIRYSYSDIKKMTRGFREKLGQGGYGTVYKGKLRSGYDVAVKLLTKTGGNGQDFMNEIATIGRIHHVNVVNLVGYCAERSKLALLFDFMPNGSLDKYIFSRAKKNGLSWERKFEIAVGVARGIEYLHRGYDIQILHFDIKPHNILLDDNFTPKITDFGLAKFCSTEKNMMTLTTARGTIGYIAPELINRGFGGVSYKADVYSFGMLLMEMAGLNKNMNGNNQASSQYFRVGYMTVLSKVRILNSKMLMRRMMMTMMVCGKLLRR